MTKIITFSDGFTTNTTPTITQEIEVDTLILPNQTQDEILSVDGSGEVVSTGLDYNVINERPGPNYCINGNFDFWQRGASSASNGYQTADRFHTYSSGSSHVVSYQDTAGTEAFQAKYFHRVVVTSVAGASNYSYTGHRIEDVRTFSNEPVTVSLWAKADSSKNIAVEIRQNYGTGGSPSSTNTTHVETLALTSSWQQFTFTFDALDVATKTIGTAEDSYFNLRIFYDAGSTYNSNTNSLGQQSGTFDIAQIKIEKGSVATPFCLSGITLAGELVNCQRYYEKSYAHGSPPGTSTATGAESVTARATSSTSAEYVLIPYKVQKYGFATPTVTVYPRDGGAAGDIQVNATGAGSGEVTAAVASYNRGFRISTTSASGLTTGDAVLFYFHWASDNEIV
jgi:hypothetical protein